MDAVDKKLGLTIQPDKGRVTAGLPSLDSSRRFVQDCRAAKTEKQRFLHADTDQRRDAAVAPDGTRPTTEYDAQRGIELHATEIMRRLKLMNANLRFEVSIASPDRTGIYLNDRYLCAFESGISPEFAVRLFREEEVADPLNNVVRKVKECTGIIKGWRDLLVQLMREGLITRSQVDKMFGVPGRDSRNWQRAVQ